jgi:hypothetical protein
MFFLGNSIFSLNSKQKDLKDYKEIADARVNEIKQPIKIIEESIKETTKIEEKETKIKEPKKSKKKIKQDEFNMKLNDIETIEDNKEWFLEYKNLIFKYQEWIDVPETVFDMFTEEEVTLICRMVETECYGKDFNSKVNVACVAFNRFNSGKFGDTMKEIITKPKQFAYGRINLTEDTILAVQYAFEIGDTTDGCIAFRSGKLPEKWYTWKDNYWSLVFVDEAGHGFYK